MDTNQLVTDEPFHCNTACTTQGKAGRFYKELLSMIKIAWFTLTRQNVTKVITYSLFPYSCPVSSTIVLNKIILP